MKPLSIEVIEENPKFHMQ